MSYSTLQPANYLIGKGIGENRPVDPLKIQKLSFISHGLHLALLDRPLIEEPPEAWRFGPVFPTLFATVSTRDGFLHEPLLVFDDEEDCFLSPSFNTRSETDRLAIRVLEKTWEIYRLWTGIALSNLTHAPDAPWTQTRAAHSLGPEDRSRVEISQDLIRDFYKSEVFRLHIVLD